MLTNKTSIRSQSLIITVLAYVGVAIGFVNQGFLIPNFVTVDQRGLIELLQSFVLLFSIFANLGFSAAGTRLFPYFRDESKQHNGFLWLCIAAVGIGLLIVSIVLVFGKPQMISWYQVKSALFLDYYWVLFPMIFFTVFFNVFDNYAKLNYDSVSGNVLSSVFFKFLNLLAIGLVALGVLTFKNYIIALIFMNALIATMMILRVNQMGHLFLKPKLGFLNAELFTEIIKYCSIAVFTSISSQIVFKITEFMLSSFSGLSATGIYGTATQFTTVISLPIIAINKVTSTVVGEAWKANDLEKIRGIYKTSCMMQLIAGLLAYLMIVANLDYVFAILPTAYESGKIVVLLLGLSKLFDMATGINGVIISTSKYYYFDTVTFFLLALVSFALNYYLLPIYGIYGGGVVACISILFFNVVRYFFIYYKFGFQPFDAKNLRVAFFGLVVFLILYYLPHFGQSFFTKCLDFGFRSSIVLFGFIGPLYWFKVSPDTNMIIDKSVTILKKWLK